MSGEQDQMSETRDQIRRRLHLPEHRGHFASRLLYPRKHRRARWNCPPCRLPRSRLHEPAAALQALGRPDCVEIVGLKARDLNELIREVDMKRRAVMRSAVPRNSMVGRK